MQKQEKENESIIQEKKSSRLTRSQNSKEESSKSEKSLSLKSQTNIITDSNKPVRIRRKHNTSNGKEVLVRWNDGLINIVHSKDLYCFGGRYRPKSYKIKAKGVVGEKVQMKYKGRWYNGSILSVDEAEFIQIASKYPPKHFKLRDPDMVVYTGSRKAMVNDSVLSEDEDLQMVIGEDLESSDLRSCGKDLTSEINEEVEIISECIEVQSIKIEDFHAMDEEVIELSESEAYGNKVSNCEYTDIPFSSLIKPCSVVIETNIANEMNMTDVYLVDQRVKVSLTDSDSEDISKLVLVKSPSPEKLRIQSQSSYAEYKLTPEISKHLSSCKELELFPLNARNQSQLPTKQSSPQKKNTVKSKSLQHCSESSKGLYNGLKIKHEIKDKFSKLIASKLNLKGVDIIPIENLDVADEGDISVKLSSKGQSLYQPVLDLAPAATSSASLQQICVVESSMETVTSRSSSCINGNEMHLTNQTSKITNTFNCSDSTLTVTQQLMRNTFTSLPKVITLPVFSCENYFSTTGLSENSSVSKLPFSFSNVESKMNQKDVHTVVPSLTMSAEDKASPKMNPKDIHSVVPSLTMSAAKKASPKMNQKDVHTVVTSLTMSAEDKASPKMNPKDIHSVVPSLTMSAAKEVSPKMNQRGIDIAVPSLTMSAEQKASPKINQKNVHTIDPSLIMSAAKKASPKMNQKDIHTVVPSLTMSTEYKASPKMNPKDIHTVVPSLTMSAEYKASPKINQKDIHNVVSSLTMSTEYKASPKMVETVVPDLSRGSFTGSLGDKASPKQQSPALTNLNRLNSTDCRKLQTSVVNQQTPLASNNSNLGLNSHSSEDNDSQDHLITASIRNCDIIKEPTLENCVDGVPPFIQDVFLCDNIRDGFINSDLVFVLSLLPDMEEMTDTQKFHFQMKIIETLNEVLDDPKLQIKGFR